jgi:outer membrane protein TolC
MTRRLTRFGVAIVGLLVAGCTVGPNYVRPTLPTPDTIRGSQASTTVALGEAKWWEVFQDAELQALVRTALTQNEDLRIAAARILEAEAQLGITRADQYPTVTAEAAGGAARSTSSNSTPATTAGAVRVGATADWVLDFWGRYRRATESARAQLLSTEWGQRAALFGIGAGSWSAVVSAAQPVFTGGRTRSQVAFAEARTKEAAAAYSQTVKQAFREASDSLVGYTKAREFRVQQEALTTAAQDARRLADVRYQGGATSYLEVLDADTRLFEAELALAQARQAELSAFVEVYRALGGGWQQEGLPSN